MSSDQPDALCQNSVAWFDWVGTGKTEPKKNRLTEPYDTSFYVARLDHFASAFEQPVILVAAGAAETIAVCFAARFPHRVTSLVIATGLSNNSVSRVPNEWRRQLAFAALRGPLGDLFWPLVRNRRYITGFSRKNLLVEETWMTEWVNRAMEGSVDDRIRFGVYSFISGYLFGDFTEDYAKIQVPCAFFASTLLTKRSVGNIVKSARPPIPIVANEAAFRETSFARMGFRVSNIPNCVGVIVEGSGVEMFFEQAEKALPKLEQFVSTCVSGLL